MDPVLLPIEAGPMAALLRSVCLPNAEESAIRVLNHHREALRRSGRVEIDVHASESIVRALVDSPWLQDSDAAETLCEWIDLFYHLKNATGDLVDDALLLDRMRRAWDGVCRGSIELLADHFEGGFPWR